MGGQSSKAMGTAEEVISTARASVAKQASRQQYPRPKAAASMNLSSESREDRGQQITASIARPKLRPVTRANAMDPDLISRLKDVGQVKVPRYATNFKPVRSLRRHYHLLISEQGNQMLDIMRQRTQQDADAELEIRNRLPVDSIFALLDARKEVTSREELEGLCRAYNVDTELVQSLAETVNTPSVVKIPSDLDGEGELFKVGSSAAVDHDLTLEQAQWKDPPPF
jgi:hypothetical protein